MPATTTLLGLVTPTQGTLTGTWGDTVNYGITDYVDIAIAGTLAFAGDGAITLANTTGSSAGNSIGATTAQYAIIRVTGTLTTAKIITGPSYSKTYLVVNAATGSTVTFKASGQTGVSIAVGETALVYYNGTDYVKVVGTATAGAAGGSTTQVQYNNAGVLAGITGATSNGTALTLVAPDLGSPSSVGTMPAFTLGGTVSGGGNQINNVVIGTTTPLAGAFTTLSATGNTTVGFTGGTAVLTGVATSNGFISHFMQNDSTGNAAVTRFMLGNNTSTGAAQFVVYGGNHATLPNVVDLNNANNAALRLLANNAVVAQVNPTGLAVTGTLSSTGILAVAANAVSTIGGFSGTDAPTSMNLRLNRGATQFNGIAFAGAVTYDRGIYLRPSSDTLHIGRSAGGVFTDQLSVDGSGNVTVIGSLSGGTSGTGYSFSGSAPATSLTLDASGLLGIGTSSPAYKLDVAGDIKVANAVRYFVGATEYGVSFANAGAVGTEAYQGTYIYWGTGASTSATEKMRLDTSGNLGLGVTPSAWVDDKAVVVNFAALSSGYEYGASLAANAYRSASNVWRYQVAPSQAASRYNQVSGQHQWFTAPSGTAGNAITFTQAMTLDASGNLLVGATSSFGSGFSTFQYLGSTYNGISVVQTDNASGSRFMNFAANGASCGVIDRVGTTSAVVYTATSDYRLKNVTGAVTGQGARIDALKPIDYRWKEDNSQTRGFLAHEFQTVYPNSVTGEKDAVDADGKPKYQAMQASSSEVIADLVAEIQSLRVRLAALEAK